MMGITIAEFFNALCEVISALSILAPGVIFFFKLYNRAKEFLHSQKLISIRVEETSRKISSDLDNIRNQVDGLASSDKIQSEGLLCVLRERLIKTMKECILRGYADESIRDRIEHMYHAYKQLGGNGMVENIHDQFQKLKLVASKDIIPNIRTTDVSKDNKKEDD